MKNFHQLMIALSCFDLLYVAMSIMIFSIPTIFPTIWSSTIYLYVITICLPIAQVGMSGSIYLTVAIAVERYSTVCHPFWKVMFSDSENMKSFFLNKSFLVDIAHQNMKIYSFTN